MKNFHVHIFKTKYLASGLPIAGVRFQAEKVCFFMLRKEFLLKKIDLELVYSNGEKFIKVNNPKLKKTIFYLKYPFLLALN